MKFNIDAELHGAVVRVLGDLLRAYDEAISSPAPGGDGCNAKLVLVSDYDYACLRSVFSDLTARKRNG